MYERENNECWQITVDEANGKEYFGQSDDRSSVVLLYLQALVGRILHHSSNLPKFSLFNNFPRTSVPICFAGILILLLVKVYKAMCNKYC